MSENNYRERADLEETLLVEFIKEDRNEIRAIKIRIYTYIQALIVASFAISAFLLKDGKTEWDLEIMVILTNVLFLILSWVVFCIQYKDLHFVRQCLQWRECRLTYIYTNYFGPKEKCEKEHVCEFKHLDNWKDDIKIPCSGNFPNDKLLRCSMYVSTAMYIILIAVVIVFMIQ